MSNPDMKISSIDSLTLGIPVAILFFLITILLFKFRDSLSLFKLVLWLGFPLLSLLVISVVNIISQYISCNTTNIRRAILGALPSVAGILIAIGVSSITYCRIPIASVFAPSSIGKSVDITKDKSTIININSLKNSKECCIPKLTLESIENRYPYISGISYGFYIGFSILFSMVIGTGISTIC